MDYRPLGKSGLKVPVLLRQNLDSVGWSLSAAQIASLDEASSVTAPYPHFPYRRQEGFARLNPPVV